METKHTATPWIIERVAKVAHDGSYYIFAPQDSSALVATVAASEVGKEIAQANAEFIIHAVNNYADAIRALRDLRESEIGGKSPFAIVRAQEQADAILAANPL